MLPDLPPPSARSAHRSLCAALLVAPVLLWSCSDRPPPEQPEQPARSAGESPASMAEKHKTPVVERGMDLLATLGTAKAASVPTVGDGEVQELVSPEIQETDQERWPEELVTNELVAGPLRALRELSLGPWRNASWTPDALDAFVPDARIVTLDTGADAALDQPALGVERSRWTQAPEAVDPAAFAAWLERMQDESRRVRWVQWKPAEVKLTPEGASTQIKVRLNRELADGGLEHRSGRWRMEWIRTEDGWRCTSAVPEGTVTALRSDAPHWVDATAEAFGGTRFDPRAHTPADAKYRGLALVDLDADDDLDLVVAQPLALLFNRGDGTFVDRSDELLMHGSPGRDLTLPAMSVLAADFDRDGDQDLFFSIHRAHCALYLQDDEGRFAPRAVEVTHDDNFPASLAAHDIDGDGWLDVFVSGYGPLADPGPDRPDDATNGQHNQVLRGLPGGRFEDVTEAWGFAAQSTRWSFAAAFGDADADGDHDLYVANDFGPNVLYRRQAGPEVAFVAEVEPRSVAEPGFSMSAAFADLDGDAVQDLYVSNMSSTAAKRLLHASYSEGSPESGRAESERMNQLRRQLSKGNALLLGRDQELVAANASGAENASWAWGTALVDYDCDGDVDIHCLNGFRSRGRDDGQDL